MKATLLAIVALLVDSLEALPGHPWTISASGWTARDGGVWATPKARVTR